MPPTACNGPVWTPVEQKAPELLEDLMYMGRVTYGGRTIHQYKHMDTRRYLSLDEDGKPWQIAVDSGGGIGARGTTLAQAKRYVTGQDG